MRETLARKRLLERCLGVRLVVERVDYDPRTEKMVIHWKPASGKLAVDSR